MLTKEQLMNKIAERKANREKEISKIPMRGLRMRYQSLLTSDEHMRKFFLEIGDMLLKYCNNALMIPIFSLLNSTIGLYSFKRQFNLGKDRRGFLDSAVDYYMFASSYGAWDIEVDIESDDVVVAYFNSCPVKCDGQPKLCRAATSMEPQLSTKEWFGAVIDYTERIPDGAERCKVVFRQK